jgi:hypothetical protein
MNSLDGKDTKCQIPKRENSKFQEKGKYDANIG